MAMQKIFLIQAVQTDHTTQTGLDFSLKMEVILDQKRAI
jgi:hypothetical protein